MTSRGLIPLLRQLKDVSLLPQLPYALLLAHYKYMAVGDLFQHQILYATVYAEQGVAEHFGGPNRVLDFEAFRCGRLQTLLAMGSFTALYEELGPLLLSSRYLYSIFESFVSPEAAREDDLRTNDLCWLRALQDHMVYWPLLLHMEKLLGGAPARKCIRSERDRPGTGAACTLVAMDQLAVFAQHGHWSTPEKLLSLVDHLIAERADDLHAAHIHLVFTKKSRLAGTHRLRPVDGDTSHVFTYLIDYRAGYAFCRTAGRSDRPGARPNAHLLEHLLGLQEHPQGLSEVMPEHPTWWRGLSGEFTNCRTRVAVSNFQVQHEDSGAGRALPLISWAEMETRPEAIPCLVPPFSGTTTTIWAELRAYREQIRRTLRSSSSDWRQQLETRLAVLLPLVLPFNSPLLLPAPPSDADLTELGHRYGRAHLLTRADLLALLQSYLPPRSPACTAVEEWNALDAYLTADRLAEYYIQVFSVNLAAASGGPADWQELTNVIRYCPLCLFYRPCRV